MQRISVEAALFFEFAAQTYPRFVGCTGRRRAPDLSAAKITATVLLPRHRYRGFGTRYTYKYLYFIVWVIYRQMQIVLLAQQWKGM